MRLRVTSGLMLLAAISSPCRAQHDIEIGPFAGYYRPLGRFDQASVFSTALPATPQDLAGLIVGIDGRVWLSRRFGVELEGALSGGSVGPYFNPGFGTENITSYDVQMLAVQVLAQASAGGRRLWIGGGPGVVRHAGNAYSPYGSPADLAGVASAGGETDVGRFLAISVGVSALAYNFDLRTPSFIVNARMEHGRMIDAAVRVGLMWRIHPS